MLAKFSFFDAEGGTSQSIQTTNQLFDWCLNQSAGKKLLLYLQGTCLAPLEPKESPGAHEIRELHRRLEDGMAQVRAKLEDLEKERQ